MRQPVQQILKTLKRQGSERNRKGMARFGIAVEQAYGVPVPVIRKLAKEIGKDHALALALWKTKNHEARLLATMIDDPKQVTRAQMNSWVKDFDSWDVCDQACMNLFDKTSQAFYQAEQWSKRKEEFARRAGFALMAALAFHDKKISDSEFQALFKIIERTAADERNFVRKAVNWALRQIGKRNMKLNVQAIQLARDLSRSSDKTARWIGADALRELTSQGVRIRLQMKLKK